MKYYYRLFNHIVESDLVMPEAIPVEKSNRVDIRIKVDQPPQWVWDFIERGRSDYISEDIMWFYLKDTLIYYVEKGNLIKICILKQGISEAIIRAYLTGSAITLALSQRGYYPIHGSVVVHNDKSIILSGASGSGKSTISLELYEKGYPFLSDDIAFIDASKTELITLPGFPQQKVCRDFVDYYHIEDELVYIDENRDKFGRILKTNYIDYPVRVDCLIELIADDGDDVTIHETTGANKFQQLISNTYRGEIYQRLEKTQQRMAMIYRIANQIPMYKLYHPKKLETIGEVVSVIESSISSKEELA